MSFLGEPFKHDLFVSYSHGAFKGKHDSHLKLWSQKFAEDLRAELAGSGEFDDISVFLDESERPDENVDRTEQLTTQLRERVVSSALFTLLMTPQYLKSKWCLQEFDWWCEKHHPDTLGAGGRVYVCQVRPSDKAAWPNPIADLVGYHLYDRDKETEKARPFTWMGSSIDRDDYVARLIDVSGEMMQRLRGIKAILVERRRQQQGAQERAAANGQILFLHGRDSATDAWNQACDHLQDAGFYVVPERPVPLTSHEGLDPEYVKQLLNSHGLLLLATEAGPAIDTDIVFFWKNFRTDAVGSSMPCAVLDAVGQELQTDRRLKNIKNLRMGWIDSTIKDWPNQVRAWLLGAQPEPV
jgi:hypothetical protein